MSPHVHSIAKRIPAAVTALTIAATTAGLTLSAPTPANADPKVFVSCSTTGQAHFTPGIQIIPLPEQVTWREDGNCQDYSGNGIDQATLSTAFQNQVMSCVASPASTGTGSGIIEWTLGNESKITSGVDLNLDRTFLNMAHITGVVRQGAFIGRQFAGDVRVDFFQGAGDCTAGIPSGGLTEASLTGNFTIN